MDGPDALLRRMTSLTKRRAAVLAAALVVGLASPVGAAPFDPPVPQNPSLSDLTATTTPSGDGHGPLPGTNACATAKHDALAWPRDDGPHPSAEVEWWWWRGHLDTTRGEHLAFIVYVLGHPQTGTWTADLTILDVTHQRFHYSRQPLLSAAQRPQASASGAQLSGDGLVATDGRGQDLLDLTVDGIRLQLTTTALTREVLPLKDGFTTFYCNSSYFYTRPHMAIRGTVTRDGRSEHVAGQGGFDHQWGFLPGLDLAQWHYISLELADGRSAFLGSLSYPNQRRDFQMSLGYLVDRHGTHLLHPSDYRVTATQGWRRDATCSYDVGYDLTIRGEHFHIAPTLIASELRADPAGEGALWQENPVYWDGETRVTGSTPGVGWLDLAHVCTT